MKTWADCLSDWGMGHQTLDALRDIIENDACAALAQAWVDEVRDTTAELADAGLEILDRVPAAVDEALKARGIDDWTR